jgi:hypothetical protein
MATAHQGKMALSAALLPSKHALQGWGAAGCGSFCCPTACYGCLSGRREAASFAASLAASDMVLGCSTLEVAQH